MGGTSYGSDSNSVLILRQEAASSRSAGLNDTGTCCASSMHSSARRSHCARFHHMTDLTELVVWWTAGRAVIFQPLLPARGIGLRSADSAPCVPDRACGRLVSGNSWQCRKALACRTWRSPVYRRERYSVSQPPAPAGVRAAASDVQQCIKIYLVPSK